LTHSPAAVHHIVHAGVGGGGALLLAFAPARQGQVGTGAARFGGGSGHLVAARGLIGQAALGLQFLHARGVAVARGGQLFQAQRRDIALLHQRLLARQRGGRDPASEARACASCSSSAASSSGRLPLRRLSAWASARSLRACAASRLRASASLSSWYRTWPALTASPRFTFTVQQRAGAAAGQVDQFGFGVAAQGGFAVGRAAARKRNQQRNQRAALSKRAGGGVS
jgi:hypothetical protein